MTIRRVVRVVGKGLISVGVLVFLFVASRIAYALGLPFFVGALYFCYENIARLLPANA